MLKGFFGARHKANKPSEGKVMTFEEYNRRLNETGREIVRLNNELKKVNEKRIKLSDEFTQSMQSNIIEILRESTWSLEGDSHPFLVSTDAVQKVRKLSGCKSDSDTCLFNDLYISGDVVPNPVEVMVMSLAVRIYVKHTPKVVGPLEFSVEEARRLHESAKALGLRISQDSFSKYHAYMRDLKEVLSIFEEK